MANLLPNEIKQNIQQDLLGRKLVVGSIIFMIFLLIVLVILVSFWASLSIRQGGSINFSPALDKKTKDTGTVALVEKIKTEGQVVENYLAKPLLSEMVAKIIALKPANIKILNIAILRSENDKVSKISLIGLAGGRNEIVNYVNILRQGKYFTKVDLPVESLLSDTGGQFMINLEK